MSKLFVSALSKTFLFRKESDTCWICFIVSTWETVIVLLCCWCCCPSCTAVHVHVVVHLPARPSSAHLQLSWLFSMFVFMLGPGRGCLSDLPGGGAGGSGGVGGAGRGGGGGGGAAGLEFGVWYLHSSEIMTVYRPHSSLLTSKHKPVGWYF